jgi:hypothetical protein
MNHRQQASNTAAVTGRAATRFTELHQAIRGHDFYPPQAELAALPPLYATEATPLGDKRIGLHYFAGSCDWWVIELDQESMLAFGYACLGDPVCAEFGYIDLSELCGLRLRSAYSVIERDLHWTPRTVAEAGLPGWGIRAAVVTR